MIAQAPVMYNYYAKMSHFTLKIPRPNIYNLYLPSNDMSHFPVPLLDVSVVFIDLLLCLSKSFQEVFLMLPLQSCCGRANNTLSAGALAALSVSLTPGVSTDRPGTLG